MTEARLVTCSFCGLDQDAVPRLVMVRHGPAICSPCVLRCLHVLVTGDEVSASDEPSFALTPLGREVKARIAPPTELGAL